MYKKILVPVDFAHASLWGLDLARHILPEGGELRLLYVLDEIIVIAAPDHPLFKKSKVALEDLQAQEFIMREPGSATRQSAEDCIAQHGMSLNITMELGSNEAVKRAVAAGLGLGMVSKFAVTPDTVAGFIKVIPVLGWRCTRPLTVFYRDDRHLPSAQGAFLRFLQEEKPMPHEARSV